MELTKFLRLTVYSYLDLKTTVNSLSLLSKGERDNLKNSGIAREGKTLQIVIGKPYDLVSLTVL